MTGYTKEMELMLLQQPELIEQATLVERVEAVVFKAIDARISKRLASLPDWEASYEWGVDGGATAEETTFRPIAWPKRKDGAPQAGYRLRELAIEGGPFRLLSHALGLIGGKLSFEFWIEGKAGRPPKAKIKDKLHTFLAANPELMEAGFGCHEQGIIFLPFSFDAAKVSAEYPNLNKALAPLDAAIEALLKAHPVFEALVREVLPQPAAAPKEQTD